MSNSLQFIPLIQETEFQRAHRRHLRARGVHLIVTHSCHIPGTLCGPGEMIEDIALGGRPEPLSFCFSHMSLLLVDCFSRYRLPLTASRIEQIMSTDLFYVHYAANRIGKTECIARPDHKSVRVYIPRIWRQMGRAFKSAGLNIDPQKVLVIEPTDSNTVTYRMKASFDWVHVNRLGSVE